MTLRCTGHLDAVGGRCRVPSKSGLLSSPCAIGVTESQGGPCRVQLAPASRS